MKKVHTCVERITAKVSDAGELESSILKRKRERERGGEKERNSELIRFKKRRKKKEKKDDAHTAKQITCLDSGHLICVACLFRLRTFTLCCMPV